MTDFHLSRIGQSCLFSCCRRVSLTRGDALIGGPFRLGQVETKYVLTLFLRIVAVRLSEENVESKSILS